MRGLRWVAALPAAAVFGYLAYLVGGFVNNFTTAMFVGPPRGWIAIALDFMAHMYMGAAATYAAVRIAPAFPKHVAAGMFGLLLLFGGASTWSAIVVARYTAILSVGGLLFGSFAVLIGALAGEVTPYLYRAGAGKSGSSAA